MYIISEIQNSVERFVQFMFHAFDLDNTYFALPSDAIIADAHEIL